MRIVLLALALLLVAADLRSQDAAPADTLAIDWHRSVDSIKNEVDASPGARFVAVCPAGGSNFGNLWGTGTYTSDSAICPAAVHVGALTVHAGGAVVVEFAPGLQEYVGTERNGFASSSYPAWHASFRFPDVSDDAEASPTQPVIHELRSDWLARANQVTGGKPGTLIKVTCPAGGSGGSVWGTDIYTDDSAICEAAVHAGVIPRAEGGLVRIELLGAQPSFRGSVQNGVSTMDYPAWPGSFRFVPAETAPGAQP
jgi:hypothetical protein